jgi:hypothetical protein
VVTVMDIAFGQLTTGTGSPRATETWHVLRPDGEGWKTACTADTARPNLVLVNVSPEPGTRTCGLVRCERAIEAWRASRTPV